MDSMLGFARGLGPAPKAGMGPTLSLAPLLPGGGYMQVVGYTYYSYRLNAKAKGIGWRLDYFLVSLDCFGGDWAVSLRRPDSFVP